MAEWLTNKDGKIWVNDKGEKVPKYCTECGAKVGLYIYGEPVFLCSKNDKHYFGTMPFPVKED